MWAVRIVTSKQYINIVGTTIKGMALKVEFCMHMHFSSISIGTDFHA